MMNQDKVSKLSDKNKSSSKNVKAEYKPSYGERWDKAQATKKVVFWFAVGAVILTLFIGFNWGGWITGGTGRQMTDDAVVQRLALICVAQFNQDPGKAQKLNELKEVSAYRRDDYVQEQGWATMPGEDKPDRKVADACAEQLMAMSQ
jgi:hypothetical protein